MRRMLGLLILLFTLPAFGQAVDPPSEQSGNVAHGAEEGIEEMVDETDPEGVSHAEPGEGAHDPHHEEQTFLGLPAWIWKLANMLLFFFVLYWFLGGPVKSFFAERKKEIGESLAEAERRRERADRMEEEIKEKLAVLEKEIAEIRERADEEGQRIAAQISESTERDLEKVKAAARSEIDQRMSLARRELREHAAELAAERAETMLETEITEADRDRLFEQGLSRLEETRT